MTTATATLYSTICTIRNKPFLLSIINVNTEECRPVVERSTSNAYIFSTSEISVENVKSSSTRLRFESINQEYKSMTVKKTILLDHFLHVQRYKFSVNKKNRSVPAAGSAVRYDEPVEDMNDISRRTSLTTVESGLQHRTQSQMLNQRRQFSVSRLFSYQSTMSVNGEPEQLIKSYIDIRYVDISDAGHWKVKRLRLQLENEDIAETLCKNLNACLSVLSHRPRKLLVFINPYCGKGRAQLLYEKKILPLFEEAGIDVTTIYTKRANHAQEFILNENLDEYHGLVCVGGDGMFAELCHGLLLRTMVEANLDINDPDVNLIQPDLRIGIIPAGSTDAVVYGTTGSNDPVTSALQIIVGESLAIDINTVHNENGFVRFMAAMLAYGFFGDIIRQSDKWRCLGPLRYDVSGICQFFRHKSYHTQVTMKLAPKPIIINVEHEKNDQDNSCTRGLGKILNICPKKNNHIDEKDSKSKCKKNRSSFKKKFCQRHCETCADLSQYIDKESSMTTLDVRQGNYTAINCLNMPGRCGKSKFGMSPYVHLGDGSFDLILVKNSWRVGFLRFLLHVANNSLAIHDLPNVERYHVNEVLITPLGNAKSVMGNWACDGELISGQEIRVRVQRQALNLFASGIHLDNSQQYKSVKPSTPILVSQNSPSKVNPTFSNE